MKLLDLFLGIMSALGGFVDIGELVFTLQAGAKFGYALLWVLVLLAARRACSSPWPACCSP